RALAGRVVILFDAVHDALSRGEVDDAIATDRIRDGAALGRVLAFGLDRDRIPAEYVEMAFGECLLIQFAAFGGRRDGIEDAGVRDARFGMVRDELVAVGGHPNPGKARLKHEGPPRPAPRGEVSGNEWLTRRPRRKRRPTDARSPAYRLECSARTH